MGGLSAAVAAGVTLVTIYPISPDQPGRPNYGPVVLTVVVIGSFICGGFVGRRAFSALSWSDMLPSVIASYAVMGFLCLISSLDLSETARMVGFVSVGIVTSAVVLLLLGHRFPPETPNKEV